MATQGTPQPIDLSSGLIPSQGQPDSGIDLSAGIQPSQASASEQPSVLERAAQGFGAGAAGTLIGLGKIGSKIPGVPYVAEKAGDIMGLPKLRQNTLSDLITGKTVETDPYKIVEQGIKPAEEAATETLAGKIGYGGETLTEFLLGDAALKGMPLADKLANASKVAKLFEASPRLMKAVQAGADLLKIETYLNPSELEFLAKSPVLRRLVTAGSEAIRQGVVQTAQTTAKTGGDIGEGVKQGAEMGAVSGVLGAATGAIGGVLEKGKKAAKTVETLSKVAEKAPSEPEVTSAAQSAINVAKEKMHSAYDTGIKDIAGRLEGKSVKLEGSPLQAKAKELLKTTAEHPEGLTKELRESLQGMVPGTERGQKMLETLAGVKEETGKAPSFIEKEFGGVAEDIKPPEDLSIDNLIKYRENLGKVSRDLPHDDPNIKTIYGLLDGVDDTIEKMAKESGDKTLSKDYDALRQAYKEKVKFFQPSNKPADQMAYNTVKVLRSGTKDDIGKYLFSGGNTRAKVKAVQELLGPEQTKKLGQDVFSTVVKESGGESGHVNPANLVRTWSKIPPDARNALFDAKIGEDAIKELMKDAKSARTIQVLSRAGLATTAGGAIAGGLHSGLGTLLGLVTAGGGFAAGRDLLDKIVAHPAWWKSLGIVGKTAEKVSPAAKVVGPAAKQQVTQMVKGKPNLSDVYQGAAQPLGEIHKERGVFTNQ